MDPILVVIVAVIALAIGAAAAWLLMTRRRRDQLRRRFGPEYQRTVQREGSVHKAEDELDARARRVESLHIRPLNAEDATRFAHAWRAVQARFVDDPGGAVTEAEGLVEEVMAARGYPVGDFEQRVADLSVDHADVVMNYRAARDIAADHRRGRAGTEELRQAMVHYRALFAHLLGREDARRADEREAVETLHPRSRR
jgi:hypothetical protein